MTMRTDAVKFVEKTMPPPKTVRIQAPITTPRIKSEGLQGTVVTRCIISTSGAVENCCIEQGVDGLNESVFNAVRQWRYEPYVWQGRTINLEYPIPVRIQRM